jgi:pseudouridine-5'-phosphate glycosidase
MIELGMTDEVAAALQAGRPVVALESTIVAHGFPRPDNLAVGQALEQAVRDGGAVPATIAVLDGRPQIGLTPAGLERLANATDAVKVSTRDLPHLLAVRGNGATTVAATMVLAARAGIRVFATGGIGGVHPAQPGHPADVSADLAELARTPVAVVCAGAKSILDLPATLEMLETLGVPVIGYGTDEFPAFHARESGLRVGQRVDDAATMAAVLHAQDGLDLACGTLICNPPPTEAAVTRDVLDGWVAKALAEAQAQGVKGAKVTPFLLAALDRLSGGRSKAVNLALAASNARVAAAIASAYAAG